MKFVNVNNYKEKKTETTTKKSIELIRWFYIFLTFQFWFFIKMYRIIFSFVHKTFWILGRKAEDSLIISKYSIITKRAVEQINGDNIKLLPLYLYIHIYI